MTLQTNNQTSAAANNITINGSLEIPTSLTIIAGGMVGTDDFCGTVNIDSNIEVAEVIIKAGTINNVGSIEGAVDLYLDEAADLGTITSLRTLYPRHSNANLVYYSGTKPSNTHFVEPATFVSSDSYTGNFGCLHGDCGVLFQNLTVAQSINKSPLLICNPKLHRYVHKTC